MTSQPPADIAGAADVVATATPIVALRPSAGGLSWPRRWAGLLIVALGLPLLTAVLVAARSDLSVQSMLPIYLLAVVVVAVVGGVVPALLGAVASFFRRLPHQTIRDGRAARADSCRPAQSSTQ